MGDVTKSEVKFKLRNNAERSYGFANRLCVAGSGNPTPTEAGKQVINGQPFRLPPLFEMSEAEMFKSYRGVLTAMAEPTPTGRPAVEVFVDGVVLPITAADLTGWADQHREAKGWAEPKTRDDHTAEIERAMARPEDPIERAQRIARKQDREELVLTVTAAVIAALQANGVGNAPAPSAPPGAIIGSAAPSQTSGRTRGKNDEKPE